MGKLLNDEQFRHVSYHHTDLAKTFARIKRQRAEAEAKRKAEAEAVEQETQRKVRRIVK